MDMPIRQIQMTIQALNDFTSDPNEYKKFEALDWLLRVVMAKWEAYSLERKVDACRGDR